MSDSYLDQLFSALAVEEEQEELKQIQGDIWDFWLESGEDDIDYLVEQGMEELNGQAFTQAIDTFTKVTRLAPDYVEGWNKRATAYYLRGDFKTALVDIQTVLGLEPRHFGALSGQASIYLAIGDIKRALRALEHILTLMPHEEDLKTQIKELRKKID